MMPSHSHRIVVRAFVVLFGLAAILQAADLEVVATPAPPPEQASATVRDAVGAGSLKVRRSGEDVAEFWIRDPLPLKEDAPASLGVAFPALEPGMLVGVVKLSKPWREYKDLGVAPGVYTMRYALRPSDGNHMGVSTYRDFLLLVPAASDPTTEQAWTADELHAKSMEATGQPHPATLAVFPVWDEIGEPMIVENDSGQPMLAVKLGNLVLGLVIEGHGEA